MNLTDGGLFGYCSSKCITSLKVPSSKGVSAGPIMTAFLKKKHRVSRCERNTAGFVVAHQVMTLSGTGDAETPAGGSVCMRYSQEVSVPEARKKRPTVKAAYLEVSHETAASSCRHLVLISKEEIAVNRVVLVSRCCVDELATRLREARIGVDEPGRSFGGDDIELTGCSSSNQQPASHISKASSS